MFQEFTVELPKINEKEFNIKDFGAVCGGQESNTAAFAAAEGICSHCLHHKHLQICYNFFVFNDIRNSFSIVRIKKSSINYNLRFFIIFKKLFCAC